MLTIDSAQNDTFKKLLSLTTSKGLKQEGMFLLSGAKLIAEFLRRPNLAIHYVAQPPNVPPLSLPSNLPAQAGVDAKPLHLASALFAQLDVLGTHAPILVLAQPPIQTIDIATHKPQGIEVVMPVGDPGNLGALLRSCEAFGVPRVILTREAAHPFLPKSVKASAGSVLRLPMLDGPALADFPPDCLALDGGGEPIDQFIWPENALLIVGEEGPGLPQQNFTRLISIPTKTVESLNAVVATSIALAFYALRSKSN